MTAPDQCCINVKKLLSIRRRPPLSGHRCIRGTDVTEYLAKSCGSLGFDVGGVDHLGPLLGFFGNERPEIARRATENKAAELDELSLQLGLGEAGIDLLVELIDDLGRRLCRCAEAEIAARLVAWHKFGHGRKIRERVGARYCAYRQRAELPRPDVLE